LSCKELEKQINQKKKEIAKQKECIQEKVRENKGLKAQKDRVKAEASKMEKKGAQSFS